MIKGKLRIHQKKLRRNNNVYTFEQALVYISTKELDKARKLQDKEVYVTNQQIDPEYEKIKTAAKILINAFMNLPKPVLNRFKLTEDEFNILEEVIGILRDKRDKNE